MNTQTTCERCGKAVGCSEWDIHTCTSKPELCDDCETVNHCLKHGCIPKVMSESNKAAYQRGYLDGMAKPCVECVDRNLRRRAHDLQTPLGA
jgi:hypothetical protein